MQYIFPVVGLSLVGMLLGYRAYQMRDLRAYLRVNGEPKPMRLVATAILAVRDFGRDELHLIAQESERLQLSICPNAVPAENVGKIEIRQTGLGTWKWRVGTSAWFKAYFRPSSTGSFVEFRTPISWLRLVVMIGIGAAGGWTALIPVFAAIVLIWYDLDCNAATMKLIAERTLGYRPVSNNLEVRQR